MMDRSEERDSEQRNPGKVGLPLEEIKRTFKTIKNQISGSELEN